MSRFFAYCQITICFFTSLVLHAEEPHTFTATDGRTLKAVIVSKTDTTVTIRRAEDRQDFLLQLDRLSAADQAYVKAWGAAALPVPAPTGFHETRDYSGDYAPARQKPDGKWGLINKSGKLVHDCQWDAASPFYLRKQSASSQVPARRQLFWVSREKKWCVFDAAAGSYVFESDTLQDGGPPPLATGSFFQATKGGRTGWWHVDGAALADGDEPQDRFFTQVQAALRVRNKAVTLDEPEFDSATLDRLPMKRSGKTGLADLEGRVLGSAEWDRIEHTATLDYFVVEKDGLMGLVDREGKVVEPPTWKRGQLKPDLFITNPSVLPDGEILVEFRGSAEGANPDALFMKTTTGLVKVAGKAARTCFFPEETAGRHVVSGGLTFVLKPDVAIVFGPAHHGLLPVEMWGVACSIRPSGEAAFPANVVEPEKRQALGVDYGPFYMGELIGSPEGWTLTTYEKGSVVKRRLTPQGQIIE